MGKLKPIERIVKDVKKGDLVRLSLKEKDGKTSAGHFVGYYAGEETLGDTTWISFNSRSQGAKLGYSTGAHFCVEKKYFSGGQNFAYEYEVLE